MRATKEIQHVWDQFETFPMENLTKLWFYHKGTVKKQRELSLMKEHRVQYGIAGNCFDLAIWLLDAYRQAGIEAYPIGHKLFTADAHVAIIALDEYGSRYLCDLGDQWLNPILIEDSHESFTTEKLSGFFPGAQIEVKLNKHKITVYYYRPNGKVSKQIYDAEPVEPLALFEAAEYSQNLIKPSPLLECRIPYYTELAHWEFTNWSSFLSTRDGLIKEKPLVSVEEWAQKIHAQTGYNEQVLLQMLQLYRDVR